MTYTNEREYPTADHCQWYHSQRKTYPALVINDIENEMDEKEIDSWIRLIRVLAHEIMNSIAPITSFIKTLY